MCTLSTATQTNGAHSEITAWQQSNGTFTFIAMEFVGIRIRVLTTSDLFFLNYVPAFFSIHSSTRISFFFYYFQQTNLIMGFWNPQLHLRSTVLIQTNRQTSREEKKDLPFHFSLISKCYIYICNPFLYNIAFTLKICVPFHFLFAPFKRCAESIVSFFIRMCMFVSSK